MARSNAKKRRLKQVKEHKRNPELNRITNSDFAVISQHVRVVNDKTNYNRRVKHKKRGDFYNGHDASCVLVS